MESLFCLTIHSAVTVQPSPLRISSPLAKAPARLRRNIKVIAQRRVFFESSGGNDDLSISISGDMDAYGTGSRHDCVDRIESTRVQIKKRTGNFREELRIPGVLESSDNGSGFGGAGRGDGGGSGGDGGNDEDPEENFKVELKRAGYDLEALPADMRAAFGNGLLDRATILKYFNLSTSGIIASLFSMKGFRNRVLADPNFLFKLCVQEVIGNGTALVAEISVRWKSIWDEIEYIISDIMVGLVLEFMFVWLLAPTIPLQPPQNNWWGRYIATIPPHAFAKSLPQRAYTPIDRISSVIFRGVEYGALGWLAGIAGTVITYGLMSGRKRMDPNYVPARSQPPILANSWGWFLFLSLSSNPRFQILEGIERVMNTALGSNPTACRAGIVALRFCNNFVGGWSFVHFFRWLGLQETEEHHQLAIEMQ